MLRIKKSGYPVKEVVCGFKATVELVSALDADAERFGISRSAVIRRTLLDAYRHRLPLRDGETSHNGR